MAESVSKNLGVITAYGMAVQGGFTGTKEQFYTCLDEITKGFKKIQITDITQPIIPLQWSVYSYILQGNETITFATPESGYVPTFELWLVQSGTPVSFAFGNNIWWENNQEFKPEHAAPVFLKGNTVYVLIFRYDGTAWLGSLAYTKSVVSE